MTLTLPLVLFLIAAVIFFVDFVAGFGPAEGTWGRWRLDALAFSFVALGLMLALGGK